MRGAFRRPCPTGPFDLVTSALAVHHLDADGKRDLFARIAAALAPGGRFVLGDVIVPEDPADATIPLTPRATTCRARSASSCAGCASAGLEAEVALGAG